MGIIEMANNLQDCPECGGEDAGFIDYSLVKAEDGDYRITIFCPDCEHEIDSDWVPSEKEAKESAIKNWNKW